ncbi:unnamed protein product [Microthlaspi erraticum]|uniref:Uncharacterized protein n=1 Tax=Microthlaspi erraticum TaxID=1685480 RepID=A0A6D2HFQ9_9BRAS|nr:unnamed protein product [Microthlaspi erraticum]CAA7033562.1 unnamed protein product [Microthlaspi erraticum]
MAIESFHRFGRRNRTVSHQSGGGAIDLPRSRDPITREFITPVPPSTRFYSAKHASSTLSAAALRPTQKSQIHFGFNPRGDGFFVQGASKALGLSR